jgi:hypothetical protein
VVYSFYYSGGSISEIGLCDEESVEGDFGWERRRLAGICQQLRYASFAILLQCVDESVSDQPDSEPRRSRRDAGAPRNDARATGFT